MSGRPMRVPSLRPPVIPTLLVLCVDQVFNRPIREINRERREELWGGRATYGYLKVFWNTSLLGAILLAPICLTASFILYSVAHGQGGTIGEIETRVGDVLFGFPFAAGVYLWLMNLTIRDRDAQYEPSGGQWLHDLLIVLAAAGLSLLG